MNRIPSLFALAPLVLAAFMTVNAQPVPAGQRLHIKLAPAVMYDSGGPISGSVAVADLNGDGKVDLVVVNDCQNAGSGFCKGTGEIAVLLGNGDGTFQSAVTYDTGADFADSVAVADVNGDGIPDVVASNWCADGSCLENGAVSVFLGNGDGTFNQATTYSAGEDRTTSVSIHDLNRDSRMDLLATSTDPGDYSGSVNLLLGNGDGTFQPAVNYSSGDLVAASVVAGDVNRDGIPDLGVANYDGSASVLLGNGDATFQPAVIYNPGGEYCKTVRLGDLRGSGILDMVVHNGKIGTGGGRHPAGIGVLQGNGDGTFQPGVTYDTVGLGALSWPAVGLGVDSLAIADVNGDGIPDVLAIELCRSYKHSCTGDGQVNVFLGNGDGTFQPHIVYDSGGYGGSSVAVADVDGDGRPDVIALSEQVSPSNYNGLVAVFLNETHYASKTALNSSPNPSKVNQQVTFTATVTPTPPNGQTVTFYNGKTQLGTATTKNGTATLTTSFSQVKTYTIKASYPGDPFRKKSSGSVKQVVNP